MDVALWLAAGAGGHSLGHGGGGVQLELWQAINLVGCVVLAWIFLPPVIEDLKRWRQDSADRR